jgi:hypothetical protein
MRFAPEVAVKPRPDNEPRYVRSYVFTRFAIGLLGVLLPLVLVFLEPALFDGLPAPRGSLSAYYYSGLREVFVGGLCAIGVFLLSTRSSTFHGRASSVRWPGRPQWLSRFSRPSGRATA